MTNGKTCWKFYCIEKKKKDYILYNVSVFSVISFQITEENNKIGKHIIINLIFQRYKIFKTS